MRFSIILICSERKDDNRLTADCLIKELKAVSQKAQLLIYGDKTGEEDWLESLRQVADLVYLQAEGRSDVALYADAMERLQGEFATALYGGDTWSEGALAMMEKQIRSHAQKQLFLMYKQQPDMEMGAFASSELTVLGSEINV